MNARKDGIGFFKPSTEKEMGEFFESAEYACLWYLAFVIMVLFLAILTGCGG